MLVKDIIIKLEEHFPPSIQEEWDHSGLQIGNVNHVCLGVMVCLNVDENTINQAIQNHCNLIISHHPFLFYPVHTIDTSTIQGCNIQTLIKNDITVYSMHTNYDKLRMNEYILHQLNCTNIHSIEESGIVRVGEFIETKTSHDFIQLLKNHFHLSHISYVGLLPETIKTIALCAGSGHDYANIAFKHADVYLTGDLSYSHAQDFILMENACVIELPHFIEQAFKHDILTYLPCDCIIAEEQDYFKII